MYYNINYEIVSVLVLVIILGVKWKYLWSKDRVEHQFIYVVITSLAACSWDIVAALCYGNIIPVSDNWMLVVETIYLLLAMYACYMQLRVVCTRVKYNAEWFMVTNFIMIAAMTVVLLINIGSKFMFEYVHHEFVGYFMFNGIYLIDGILFAEMAMILVKYRKMLHPKLVVFTSSIFVFPILCILIQFIDDTLLLSGIGATAAFTMFCFTMGDQDFLETQNMLATLEKTKETDRKQKEEIEAAYRVKQRFMASISGEFNQPIEEIQKVTRKMRDESTEDNLEYYLDHIDAASYQLINFVDRIVAETGSDQ